MTRKEYEQKYGLSPVLTPVSNLDTSVAPRQMTRAEYEAEYNPAPKSAIQRLTDNIFLQDKKARESAPAGGLQSITPDQIGRSSIGNPTPGTKPYTTPYPSVRNIKSALATPTSELPTYLKAPKELISSLTGSAQDLSERTENAYNTVKGLKIDEKGMLVKDPKAGEDYKAKVAGALLDVTLGSINTVLSPISGTFKSAEQVPGIAPVATGVNSMFGILGEAPKPIADFTVDILPVTDETKEYLRPKFEELAALAAQVVGGKATLDSFTSKSNVLTKEVAERIKADALRVEKPNVVKPTKATAKLAGEIENIENNYSKLRKANEFSKDAEASRLRIAETDVLANSVDADGTIRTKQKGGAIDQYRAQRIDGTESVVRDNLKREGAKVNLNEVARELKIKIAESGLEGADLITALNGVKKEIAGLKLRADELGNIGLEKVHDAKINTTKNIDYNTPPETKTYRKTVARTYKEVVENKSKVKVNVGGKEYGIDGINKELSKYYADIERLQGLDGRKVRGGRLGKYASQISGNVVGMAAGSVGGPLGAAVGSIIGGEAAGFLKGKVMERTFGRERGVALEKNPILEAARQKAGLPKETDMTRPSPKVGAAKDVPKTKEVSKIERQIEDNIKQQKAAIKAKDFTLVSKLKEVYDVLVDKLKELVRTIRNTPNKEGGFVRIRKNTQEYNLGKRNTQYKNMSTSNMTSIDGVSPKTPKKSTPPVDNLITEAKKYKTAEEFVEYMKDKEYDVRMMKNPGVDIIPIEKVKVSEYQKYAPDESSVKFAINQIKSGKGVEPITVGKDYSLLNGRHRMAAFESLGIKEIPVIRDGGKSQLTDIWNKANDVKTSIQKGGSVKIGGKTFKEIPEATKKEMIQAIDYLRIGKETSPALERIVDDLSMKYNISADLSNSKIADLFERLVEETKTS
jgi:hypothetical protein